MGVMRRRVTAWARLRPCWHMPVRLPLAACKSKPRMMGDWMRAILAPMLQVWCKLSACSGLWLQAWEVLLPVRWPARLLLPRSKVRWHSSCWEAKEAKAPPAQQPQR